MTVRPDMPPALDAIVRWCLATDPAARPSASELSMALARFVADPAGAAAFPAAAGVAPPGRATGRRRRQRRHAQSSRCSCRPVTPSDARPDRGPSGPWAWTAAGLGLLVIVASGILLFLLFSGIGDPAPSPSPTPSQRAADRPHARAHRSDGGRRRARRRATRPPPRDGLRRVGRGSRAWSSTSCPIPDVEVPAGTSVQVTVGDAGRDGRGA